MKRKLIPLVLATALVLPGITPGITWADTVVGNMSYSQTQTFGNYQFRLETDLGNSYEKAPTLAVSDNNGVTWKDAKADVTYYMVSPNFVSDKTIFAVADGMYWLSNDGGANFKPIDLNTNYKLAISQDGKYFYAYNDKDNGAMELSTDSGYTWQPINKNQFVTDSKSGPRVIIDMAVSKTGPVWALTTDNTARDTGNYWIFTSWDKGTTFKLLDTTSYNNQNAKTIFYLAQNGAYGDNFNDPTNPAAVTTPTTTPTPTTTTTSTVKFVIGQNCYWAGNKQINIDAAPYIDAASGRTMVPIRYLAEACGVQDKDITNNGNAVILKLGNTEINLTIGSTTIVVNGQAETMDVAPIVNNGRVYLPAKYIAQGFSHQAAFNAADNSITIN